MSNEGHTVDHAGMSVLSTGECFELLETVPIGRVAYQADGAIQIFPVTFRVSGTRIVFRSGLGSKLDSAEMKRACTFEADQWSETDSQGWSVIVRGIVRPVTDPIRVEALETLQLRPWLQGPDMGWIEIIELDVSGRRLPSLPD